MGIVLGTSASALCIAVVIVTTLILLCCIFYQRSKSKKHQLNSPTAVNTMSCHTITHQYVTSSELHNLKRKASIVLQSCLIEKSNLRVMGKIGQGEFGVVYRGILEEHYDDETKVQAVAIKTLKGHFNESHIEDIFEEAIKMKNFDHMNVLSLFGVSLDLMEAPCIVMPFMGGGSLLSYLRRESVNLLMSDIADENLIMDATKQLLSMCLQVAKGMTYLAQEKFVHRDLAARNCMISAEGLIKVADFGLSEEIYTTEYFKQTFDSESPVKLPIKWMALESIHYSKFNEKTDVWSFGVLCWEIFSVGKTPYPGLDPRSLVKILDAGERLSKPMNAACTEQSYSLMKSCWNDTPDERPHFSEIEQTLEQMIAPLADYMDFTNIFKTKNEFID